MSISIAICELDAANALCRKLKTDVKKVLLEDISGFEDVVEYDDVVTLEDGIGLFDDWDAFMRRNRIPEDVDAIYLDKIKKKEDLAILEPKARKVSTRWVDLADLDDARKMRAMALSKEENRLTGWDMLSFEEMNDTCLECPLSWDKGRGCIGAFGPDNTRLPEVAGEMGCTVTASVPEGVSVRRIYTPEEASKLKAEIPILSETLPRKGKMYVRRYAGVLERLDAVADISMREGCGFYFF